MKKFLGLWLVATCCVGVVGAILVGTVKVLIEIHKTHPLVSVSIVLLLCSILLGFVWAISVYEPS